MFWAYKLVTWCSFPTRRPPTDDKNEKAIVIIVFYIFPFPTAAAADVPFVIGCIIY